MKYEIQISRLHKGSPFNCSEVIPELQSDLSIDEVIDLPEVSRAIDKTFGRNLRVFISEVFPFTGKFIEYEVTKPKAIL